MNYLPRLLGIFRTEIPRRHWGAFREDMLRLADPAGARNVRYYGLKYPSEIWGAIDLHGFQGNMDYSSLRKSKDRFNPYLMSSYADKGWEKNQAEDQQKNFSRLIALLDEIERPSEGFVERTLLAGLWRRELRAFSEWNDRGVRDRPEEGVALPLTPYTMGLWRLAVLRTALAGKKGEASWDGMETSADVAAWDALAFALEEIRSYSTSPRGGWGAHGLLAPWLFAKGHSAGALETKMDEYLDEIQYSGDRKPRDHEPPPPAFLQDIDGGIRTFSTRATKKWTQPLPHMRTRKAFRRFLEKTLRGNLASLSVVAASMEVLREVWRSGGWDQKYGPLDLYVLIEGGALLMTVKRLWRNYKVFEAQSDPLGKAFYLLMTTAHLRKNNLAVHRHVTEDRFWPREEFFEEQTIDILLLFGLLEQILPMVYPRGKPAFPWGSPLSLAESTGFLLDYALASAMDLDLYKDPNGVDFKSQLIDVLARILPVEHRSIFFRDMAALGSLPRMEKERLNIHSPLRVEGDLYTQSFKTLKKGDWGLLVGPLRIPFYFLEPFLISRKERGEASFGPRDDLAVLEKALEGMGKEAELGRFLAGLEELREKKRESWNGVLLEFLLSFQKKWAPGGLDRFPSRRESLPLTPLIRNSLKMGVFLAYWLKNVGSIPWENWAESFSAQGVDLDRGVLLLEEIRRLSFSKRGGWKSHVLSPPWVYVNQKPFRRLDSKITLINF
jgi:hypothetical protein